jgi:hypothetical protein
MPTWWDSFFHTVRQAGDNVMTMADLSRRILRAFAAAFLAGFLAFMAVCQHDINQADQAIEDCRALIDAGYQCVLEDSQGRFSSTLSK